MTRWQYRVRTIVTDREDEIVIHHVQRTYSDLDWKDLPKHSPIALEAWLEEWGRDGWELVTCEPAETVGKHGDIGSSYQTLLSWRRVFLCVFKRPIEEEAD